MRRKSRSTGRRHASRSAHGEPGGSLSAAIESLERRSMLAADVLDVTKVLWNGKQVDAVRDEFIFRMPQTNASTAKSPVDYACRTPTLRSGWSQQALGTGFFRLTAPGATQAVVANWAKSQGVQSINVNAVRSLTVIPNDPLYNDGANWAFPQIDADEAWDTSTGTSSTIVAVLDTGVDYNHPDLAANMWRNPNETPGDGIDNDRNGWVDDIFGVNTIGGSSNPMDDEGHGTMCAGLIGAVGNNAVGMAGVNWTVKIMAVKIFDRNGNTSVAAQVQGINYVLSQKIAGQSVAAINCSYGGYGFVQQEFDALNQLALSGITIVAAAGNDANNNDILPAYPASYTIPGLISVAASTRTDALAGFSNFGVASVDLAAPGVAVLSTRAAQADPLVYPPYNGDLNYTVNSGTSFAAPQVAGAAGLLKSIKPAASTEMIKTAILDGADRVAALQGLVLTGGRLNLANAVDLILATQGATPVVTFTLGQNLSFLEGNVGYTNVQVKLSLDRPADPGKSVAVWYETRQGGTAISGVDFVSQAGPLTFSGAEMEKSFTIRLIGDRSAEPTERFAIRLDQAKSRGVTIGDVQANVIILDDDFDTTPVEPGPTNPGLLPRVSVDVKRETPTGNTPIGQSPQVPFREGGVATFVISLDRTSTKTVSVKYRTSQPAFPPLGVALENIDYKPTSGTLTFRPGERSKEITVPLIADKILDDGETLRMVLSEPINAEFAGAGVAGQASAIDGVITDTIPVAPPASGFQITMAFPDTSLSASQQAVFQQAANRWQEIIVGDLPNVTDPTTGQVIDDILILATGPAIDGAGGILGAAGPTEIRPGAQGLPWKGEMFFDSADIARMETDGTFKDVILHEMGHVLGFGTLWTQFGFLRGAGSFNPTYVGPNALKEYKSIFGQPSATGVPVENTGGQGTADGHWRETVFVTELMTGYAESAGTTMPISRITVGQFQDLGYTVNYAKADSYTKPAPLKAPPAVKVTVPAMLRGKPVSIASPARLAAVAASQQAVMAAMATDPVFASLGATATSGSSSARRVAGFATLGRG